MSAHDLLDDSFPHGTLDGYRQGCRSAACPAAIPCRTVHSRYSGDYSFARLIDAGVPLTEILERDAAELADARQGDRLTRRGDATPATPTPKPKATPKAKPAPKPKPAPKAKAAPKAKPAPKPPRKPAPRTQKSVARNTAADPAPAPRSKTPAPHRAKTPAPTPRPKTAAPRPTTAATVRTAVADPAPRRHRGYAWIAREREKLEELEELDAEQAADRGREIDEYQRALDSHVDELAHWEAEQRQHQETLDRAIDELEAATIAARAGLSLGGVIEQALQQATQHRDAAAAELAAHAERRPTLGKPPRQRQPHGTNACRARGCDRPECIEAGRAYHREWMEKRTADPIPPQHHGTAYGYQLGCKDRDSCPAEVSCADASLAEERRRRREAGIAEQAPRVPAEPVRRHVHQLMGAGMTVLGIAAAASVSKTGVKVLLYGRSGARKGELPAAIDAEKAKRIMALTAPGTEVSAAAAASGDVRERRESRPIPAKARLGVPSPKHRAYSQ